MGVLLLLLVHHYIFAFTIPLVFGLEIITLCTFAIGVIFFCFYFNVFSLSSNMFEPSMLLLQRVLWLFYARWSCRICFVNAQYLCIFQKFLLPLIFFFLSDLIIPHSFLRFQFFYKILQNIYFSHLLKEEANVLPPKSCFNYFFKYSHLFLNFYMLTKLHISLNIFLFHMP